VKICPRLKWMVTKVILVKLSGNACISSPKNKNWTFLQRHQNQCNAETGFSYHVLVKTLYFWLSCTCKNPVFLTVKACESL
jgi:hypothetical protein